MPPQDNIGSGGQLTPPDDQPPLGPPTEDLQQAPKEKNDYAAGSANNDTVLDLTSPQGLLIIPHDDEHLDTFTSTSSRLEVQEDLPPNADSSIPVPVSPFSTSLNNYDTPPVAADTSPIQEPQAYVNNEAATYNSDQKINNSAGAYTYPAVTRDYQLQANNSKAQFKRKRKKLIFITIIVLIAIAGSTAAYIVDSSRANKNNELNYYSLYNSYSSKFTYDLSNIADDFAGSSAISTMPAACKMLNTDVIQAQRVKILPSKVGKDFANVVSATKRIIIDCNSVVSNNFSPNSLNSYNNDVKADESAMNQLYTGLT